MSAEARVFIGTEPRMWIAETVLRYSIERHASIATRVESMDYARGGVWDGWEIGRARGLPAKLSAEQRGEDVWFTDFTNFRWAIPEVCGFQGRAIYMDVDMLVLGDVKELLELTMPTPIRSLSPGETSVMVIDCAAMKNVRGWPPLAEMKVNRWSLRRYVALLSEQGAFSPLPPEWNCLDGRGFTLTGTRLVHYTDMSTQPWRPYPERIHYRAHRSPEVENLWFHYAARARSAGRFDRVPDIVWDRGGAPARPAAAGAG